jgi:DNA-binding beta-propeller fold protein YncE
VIRFAEFSFIATAVVCMAQQPQEIQPVNSGANPYRVIRNWGMLPEGRPWGAANGVALDKDGTSVWVADSRRPTAQELKDFPLEKNKGSVVVKFSPQGKVLLTLGKFGVAGNPPDALTDPTNILTAPNGDIYVAESHTSLDAPEVVGRISVFVGEYREFSRVSGLAIDKDDTIYAADSESTAQTHPGWRKGIRIGNLSDGKVTRTSLTSRTAPVVTAGNLYTAEATVRGVTKYVKK